MRKPIRIVLITAGVVVAVVVFVISYLHLTFIPADVEKAASQFVEIKLPQGCKWQASTEHNGIRQVTIEVLDPVSLLIYLDYNPETECKDNKELLLKSLKDEMGDKYQPPKSDFTKEVGGEPMLFTEDTNSHKVLLMGATVTKKHEGIRFKAQQGFPNERKKQFDTIDQFLRSIEAWH